MALWIIGGAKDATEEYEYDWMDTQQGIFKAYAVSLCIKYMWFEQKLYIKKAL